MPKIDKQNLKEILHKKIDELVDGADAIGNINFFEINIKHTDGDLVVELKNKYKVKIK